MFKGGDRSGELNGFLDAGSHIQGELVFEDTFRVDGKLTGTVRSEGDLVVGEQGEIEAVVEVGRLFVSGTLRGEVRASRRIELASSARVEATLTSPTMVIEEGAKMDGRCITGGGTRRPGASQGARPDARDAGGRDGAQGDKRGDDRKPG